MPDIQIIVSRELGKATMTSRTIPGRSWMMDQFEEQLIEVGRDVIVYMDEDTHKSKRIDECVKDMVLLIYSAGLEVTIL